MRGVGRLPVVSRDDSKQVVGYLNRSGVLSARLKRMHEEGHRETRLADRVEEQQAGSGLLANASQ